MSNNNHSLILIKNSILVLFNAIFMFLTGWVISIWVARQLGPSFYGIFTLVLWFTDSCTWFIAMGFTHAITKFISEYKGKNANELLTPIIVFVLKIELIFSIICILLLVFFRKEISSYFFNPQQAIFFTIAFIGILPGIITAILSSAIDGIQKFEYFTLANLIITPLSFIAKCVVLYLGKGIIGLLLVMLFFSFVNVIFYMFVLIKEKVIKKDELFKPLPKEIKKRILKYNFSVLAILFCDKIVWDKSENFFLGRLCVSEQIGFFNLGFNLVQRLISFIPFMFWRVLFPAMSQYSGLKESDKMKRLYFLSTRYIAFASFPTGIGGAILSYNIIHYLYGHQYIGAQHVLQILFISSIFASLANPASAVLYGYEKQSFIFKYGIILAAFNIILDILLIKKYGAIGAAIAYALTTFFASTGGLYYTCHTMKLKFPFSSIFKILFSTIIMGISMEILLLHKSNLVGFLLCIFCSPFIYLICSFVVGSFEKEDFILLKSAEAVLPGKLKIIYGKTIKLISIFKPGKENIEY